MSESFDPYRKWLGIPPQDQPPNHYRLLGVEPFESDPDIITTAADGRMAQVKRFHTGQFSQFSQQLMNEIAAAKVCLLTPQKRAEYDEALRARLAGEKRPAVKAAPAAPKAPVAAPAVQINVGGGAEGSARARLARQTPAAIGGGWKLAGAACALGVVMIIVTAIVLRSDDSSPSEQPKDKEVAEKPVKPAVKPPEAGPQKPPNGPKPNGQDTPAPGNGGTTGDPPSTPSLPERKIEDMADPDPPPTEVAVKPEKPKPEQPKPEKPKPAEPVVDPSKKPPAPDDDAQREAEKKVRGVFEKDIADAKTPDKKLALAKKLEKQAEQTGDDPAVRFVLLKMAMDLCVAAGNLPRAVALVDTLAGQFEVDAMYLKAGLLEEAVKPRLLPPAAVSDVIETANQLVEAAMRGDDYEMAGRLAKPLLSAAKKTKDLALEREVQTKQNAIERQKTAFAHIKKALGTLAESPSDPEANLKAGRWYCFAKDDWTKGLPFLAKCGDGELAGLAQRDLAQSKETKEQTALGDGWSALVSDRNWRDKEYPAAKQHVLAHAQAWYQEALPKLAGLEKARVEGQIEKLSEALSASSGGKSGGVVVPGNVALATNGTKVTGPAATNARYLFDGSDQHTSTTSFTSSPCGVPWVIEFDKLYRLQEIRFLLLDADPRGFKYKLEISENGQQFKTVADYSGKTAVFQRSWQIIRFAPQPVRVVRLTGLDTTLVEKGERWFYVVEFEAYCKGSSPTDTKYPK